MHYVCFLKGLVSDDYIINALSYVFDVDTEEVKDILDPSETIVTFQSRILDYVSEFNIELNVFLLDKEKVLNLGLYNNLLFGLKIFHYTKNDVLINDESDDPYQYLLIRNERIFLVDESVEENLGINLLESSLKELSFEKSLQILPDENDVKMDLKNKVYCVSPSSLWNGCIM